MSKRHEWSQTVGSSWGMVHAVDQHGYKWLHGSVATPWGLVDVYSEGHDNDGGWPSSSYRFVHGGRMYGMVEPVARTKRGLAIVAARWARTIAEGEDDR